MGTWTSMLSASNLQHWNPRMWVHPISWFPSYHYHHPTRRDLVHITVPGACTFGIGAFSFWQPCYQSLFCSSVLFKVYCLPKMTSWGVADGRASADWLNVRSAQQRTWGELGWFSRCYTSLALVFLVCLAICMSLHVSFCVICVLVWSYTHRPLSFSSR